MTPVRSIAFGLASLPLLLALTGCEPHFFKPAGFISSDGGELGTWRSVPEGCTRDPAEDQPLTHTSTVATFLWRDQRLRDREHAHAVTSGPLRLICSRSDAGPGALLDTANTSGGTSLDRSTCTRFELNTHEGRPAVPGGRPTLAGTLALDCRVRGSHLTAALRFSGCEF